MDAGLVGGSGSCVCSSLNNKRSEQKIQAQKWNQFLDETKRWLRWYVAASSAWRDPLEADPAIFKTMEDILFLTNQSFDWSRRRSKNKSEVLKLEITVIYVSTLAVSLIIAVTTVTVRKGLGLQPQMTAWALYSWRRHFFLSFSW